MGRTLCAQRLEHPHRGGTGRRGQHWARDANRAVENPEDHHPPTISITEPADGTILQGDGLVVRVNAQDDVGVVRVELYVNGSRYLSTTTPPFTLRGSTGNWASGAYQLQCRAYDAAGRVGYSQVVTVHKP